MTKTELKQLKRLIDKLDSHIQDVTTAFASVSYLEQKLREKYEKKQTSLALGDKPKRTWYPKQAIRDVSDNGTF